MSSSTSINPISIDSAGITTLMLSNLNNFSFSISSRAAAVRKATQGTLVIAGTGTLAATGGYFSDHTGGAAIGGNDVENTANIIIQSGTIQATSLSCAAAIGGGNQELGNKYSDYRRRCASRECIWCCNRRRRQFYRWYQYVYRQEYRNIRRNSIGLLTRWKQMYGDWGRKCKRQRWIWSKYQRLGQRTAAEDWYGFQGGISGKRHTNNILYRKLRYGSAS